jgi:prepilin-type processing-associated H-X9-DG protein
VLLEEGGASIDDGMYPFLPEGIRWLSLPALYHGAKTTDFSFADGHVESFVWRDAGFWGGNGNDLPIYKGPEGNRDLRKLQVCGATRPN